MNIADNTGGKVGLVIGLYGGTGNKYASLGDVVKVAIKKAIPGGSVVNHSIHRAVIVRIRKEYRRDDGSYIRFDDNAAVILEGDTKSPKGTRVFGPVARELKSDGFDKIISLAPEVL